MKYKSKKNRLKKKLRKTKKRGGANLSNAAETNLERDYKKKFTNPTFKPIRQNIEASNDEQRLQLEEERENLVEEIFLNEESMGSRLEQKVSEIWINIFDYLKEIIHEERNNEELKAEYLELKENFNILLGNTVEEQIADTNDKNEFIRQKEILIDLILKCMYNNFYIYNLLVKVIKLKVKILTDKRKLLLCQSIDQFINNDLLGLSLPNRKPFLGKLTLHDNLYAYNPYSLKSVEEFIGPPIPLMLEGGSIVNVTILDYVKLILTIRNKLFYLHQDGSFSDIKNKLEFYINLIRKTKEEFEKKINNINNAQSMLTTLAAEYRESVVQCLGKMREKILANVEKIAFNTQKYNKFKLDEEENTLEYNRSIIEEVQNFDIDPDGFFIEGRDDLWPEDEETSNLLDFFDYLGFKETPGIPEDSQHQHIKNNLYVKFVPLNLLKKNSDLGEFRDWYLGEIPDDAIELWSER